MRTSILKYFMQIITDPRYELRYKVNLILSQLKWSISKALSGKGSEDKQ